MLLAAAFRASVGAHQFGKGALPWTKEWSPLDKADPRGWNSEQEKVEKSQDVPTADIPQDKTIGKT